MAITSKEVSYYYCGFNLFSTNEQHVSISVPSCLNISRIESEASASSAAPMMPVEYCDKVNDAVFQISITWKTVYLVVGGKLYVVGECDETVSGSLAETPVKDVAASWASLFILTDRDEILSVGDNGLLVKANATGRGVPQCALRAVAAGERHVLVLTVYRDRKHVALSYVSVISAKSLACWYTDVRAPESCQVLAATVDQIPSFRCLNLSTKVKSVVCGKEHVLLLAQLGQLLSYGSGSRGQLGHGSIDNEDSPKLVEALDGLSILCVSAGGWHSAAVSDIGDIYVWGWNESGQLGLPCRKLRERCSRPDIAAGTSDDTVTVLALPQVLFAEDDELNFVDVSCGSRHTAALTADHRLFAWGWNNYGQLGTGDLESRDSPYEVSFFAKSNMRPIKIKCGYWSTVVVCKSTSPADDC